MLTQTRLSLISSLGGTALTYHEADAHNGGCIMGMLTTQKTAWLFAPNQAYHAFSQFPLKSHHDTLDTLSNLNKTTLPDYILTPNSPPIHHFLYGYHPKSNRPVFLQIHNTYGQDYGVIHHTPHEFHNGLVPGNGDILTYINAKQLKLNNISFQKWRGRPLPLT